MSIEAEQYVLGALLQNHELMDDCYLQPNDFSPDGPNRMVMKTLRWAHENLTGQPGIKNPFDILALTERYSKTIGMAGGPSYLMGLKNSVPTLANFGFYQQLVRKASIQREASQALKDALQAGDVDLTLIKEKMDRLQELQSQGIADGWERISDVLDGHHKEIMDRGSRSGITGAKTASEDLNEMGGGHQSGDLTIVAARPSMGKTAYIVNDSKESAMAGYTVGMFSAEMSSKDVAERYICALSGIDARKVQKGRLTENDWSSYDKALDILDMLPIYIDDTPGMTIEYIWRQTKAMKKKYPKLIIYVDYLQLIESEKKFTQAADRVDHVLKQLKRLAKTFGVPVVAISSVGRKCEERNDKRPMMSDLRESGNIEFAGDVIIFLYRDDYYYPDTPMKGFIELIVAKGRKIGTGTIQMFFNRKNGRFANLTKDDKEQLREKVAEYEQTARNRKR
ncbi:replicative DNA helicase [Paenibacillus antibioticophila]|uniref:DNA 5'-3' helicase n=1 Tax=Paenibacillus antibioticophila TaxID=1274374 RepID=A0A919Y0E9_9BACL|nr:DnaB-like helicase C-terminal domain-containing protein [Paenibacillus antibioticophila]GIO40170.1 replicative DNA helicase [Paenibacillus antibioticophila]